MDEVQVSNAGEVNDPILSNAQIIAEATNAPTLAAGQFALGGRTFNVVSLSYRQYLQFVSKLEPVLKMVAGKVKSTMFDKSEKSVAIPGLILTTLSDIDPAYLMSFCLDDLPAMAEIVCNMEAIKAKDESNLVTAQWIEDNVESPFELINIVLTQVNKNNMIVEFASFFARVLPIFLGRKTATDQAK